MHSQHSRIAVCMLLLAPCAALGQGTPTVGTETHQASDAMSVARELNAALDSAYRKGDADAVAALLSDSVVMSAENIPDLSGRSTLRDVMAQFFAGNTVHEFSLRAAEARAFGDNLFERGVFTWTAAPRGSTAVPRNGRYMLLRIRGEDGAWRIHRYIENCLPAPCPS